VRFKTKIENSSRNNGGGDYEVFFFGGFEGFCGEKDEEEVCRVEEEENEIAGDCSLMIVIVTVIMGRVLIMGLCDMEIIQRISMIKRQSVRIRKED
jgi:hypothetical protein